MLQAGEMVAFLGLWAASSWGKQLERGRCRRERSWKPWEGSNMSLPKQSPLSWSSWPGSRQIYEQSATKNRDQALTQSSNPDDKCSITEVTPFQGCYAVLLWEIRELKIPMGSDNTSHTSNTLSTQTVTSIITERKELSDLVESSQFCFIFFFFLT